MLHLHHLFLSKPRDSASRSDSLWYSLGSISDHRPVVRFRSRSIGSQTVSNILCESLLGQYTHLQAADYQTDTDQVMGQIIGSGVLRALVDRTDQWGYRIPYALQWVWPIPLAVGMFLAPESPWWLVRQGRIQDAERSVGRLTSSQNHDASDRQKAVAVMVHTNEMEKQITLGTSYADCFKGIELRRTEICCMAWMIQILCGGGVMAFSSYFFERAGLNTSYSFDLTMAQYGLGAVGVLIAWALLPWVGRRTLFITGQIFMMVILFAVGFIGVAGKSQAMSWAVGALLLVYVFVYDITVGPLAYSFVAEMSSTRLRQKTLVLARGAYLIANIINNVLTPHMLNPTAWDWESKTGLFWAVSCFLTVVWAYYRLPEPKDRTYAELDDLFERKIPAREFATAAADPFDSGRRQSLAMEASRRRVEGEDKT
jgi:SP family general alpha glucoside:H+ symporter-like MFS transporter